MHPVRLLLGAVVTDAALRCELEERMRKAHREDIPNCMCGFVWLKPAASVAVEMIEDERKRAAEATVAVDLIDRELKRIADYAALERKRKEEAEERAEAAEKALAERGHVQNCGCHDDCNLKPEYRDHADPFRDPRCAPEAKR